MSETEDVAGPDDTPLAEILPGALAKKLARDLELHSLGELLDSVPRTYRDRGQSDPATGISDGDPIGFSGTVFGVSDNYSRGQKPRVRTVFVTVATDAGERTAVFFNMVWVKHKIRKHDFIEVIGVAKIRNGNITCVNPTFRVASDAASMTPDEAGAQPLAAEDKRESSAKETLDIADEIVIGRGEQSILERPILPVYPASKKTTTWGHVCGRHRAPAPSGSSRDAIAARPKTLPPRPSRRIQARDPLPAVPRTAGRGPPPDKVRRRAVCASASGASPAADGIRGCASQR